MTINLALFPHDRDCPTLRVPAERVECVCSRAYFMELLAQARALQDELEQLRNRRCPCQTRIGERHYTDLPGPVQTPVYLAGFPPRSTSTPHQHGGTDAPECTTCEEH